MEEYKSANGSVRNHRITLSKLDAEFRPVRKQRQNVLFERMVRATRISGCRLHHFHLPVGRFCLDQCLQMFVEPLGCGFGQCHSYCPIHHAVIILVIVRTFGQVSGRHGRMPVTYRVTSASACRSVTCEDAYGEDTHRTFLF